VFAPADSELAQFLRGIDMQISVFTPSRPYVENDNNFDNQIPDANRRRGNPFFWGFVGNMLGLEPERYPAISLKTARVSSSAQERASNLKDRFRLRRPEDSSALIRHQRSLDREATDAYPRDCFIQGDNRKSREVSECP
jgi:hypothetical protein